MNMFINLKTIDLLCGGSKYGSKYNEKQTNYDEDPRKQNKSEPKSSRWSVFKEKCKAFWGEAKEIILGIADVLGTIAVIAKSAASVVKSFKKAKGAFA